MNYEPDPEVLADLRLRDATERDSSRSRPDSSLLGTWKPTDNVVTQWKCRYFAASGCKNYVGVYADTLEYREVWNRRLASVGDEKRNRDPLDVDSVMVCDRCRDARRWALVNKLKDRVTQEAALIAEIKKSPGEHREREIVKQLKTWSHPDIPGLLEAIKNKVERSGKRVTRGDV